MDVVLAQWVVCVGLGEQLGGQHSVHLAWHCGARVLHSCCYAL